jgi:hypothetical protein
LMSFVNKPMGFPPVSVGNPLETTLVPASKYGEGAAGCGA